MGNEKEVGWNQKSLLMKRDAKAADFALAFAQKKFYGFQTA